MIAPLNSSNRPEVSTAPPPGVLGHPPRPLREPIIGYLRHSYSMRLILRVLTILGLAAFVVTSALIPQTAGANGSAKDQAPITIRIKLDRTRVVAGTPIKGTAVITNPRSNGVLVKQCAIDGWLAVGLTNRTIHYSPAFPLVGCNPSVVLAPGRHRFPVTVVTTYESCLQPGGQSTTFVPKCLSTVVSSNPLPPLPAGRYSAKVVTIGLPANTAVSNTVVVTLLPAGQ